MSLLYHGYEPRVYTWDSVLRDLLGESMRVYGCKALSNLFDVAGDVEIEQKTTRACCFVSGFPGWSFVVFLLGQKILSLFNT